MTPRPMDAGERAASRALRAALYSPHGMRLLDASGGGTWTAGGCLVLAAASARVFRCPVRGVVTRSQPLLLQHAVAELPVGGRLLYADGDGLSTECALVRRWREDEGLEGAHLSPHDWRGCWNRQGDIWPGAGCIQGPGRERRSLAALVKRALDGLPVG